MACLRAPVPGGLVLKVLGFLLWVCRDALALAACRDPTGFKLLRPSGVDGPRPDARDQQLTPDLGRRGRSGCGGKRCPALSLAQINDVSTRPSGGTVEDRLGPPIGRPSAVAGDGRRSRWRRLTIVSVPLIVVLAGCDGSASPAGPTAAGGTSTSRPSSTTTPSTTGSEQSAVEAAYRRFWAVSWDVDKQAPGQWRPLLATVSVNPVLTRLLAGTRAQREAGIRLYGQVVPRPSVTRLAHGRAEVKDCQDASNAGQAEAASGKRRTVGVARTPVTASLVRRSDGLWRVSDVRYPGEKC